MGGKDGRRNIFFFFFFFLVLFCIRRRPFFRHKGNQTFRLCPALILLYTLLVYTISFLCIYIEDSMSATILFLLLLLLFKIEGASSILFSNFYKPFLYFSLSNGVILLFVWKMTISSNDDFCSLVSRCDPRWMPFAVIICSAACVNTYTVEFVLYTRRMILEREPKWSQRVFVLMCSRQWFEMLYKNVQDEEKQKKQKKKKLVFIFIL